MSQNSIDPSDLSLGANCSWKQKKWPDPKAYVLHMNPRFACWNHMKCCFNHNVCWPNHDKSQIFQSGWWLSPTPLKNDGVRQLGWWNSQLNGKNKSCVPNHQTAIFIWSLHMVNPKVSVKSCWKKSTGFVKARDARNGVRHWWRSLCRWTSPGGLSHESQHGNKPIDMVMKNL